MLKVYCSDLDWMNYRLVKSEITQHHIIKREHGGRMEWTNIALLMPVAHQYLHLIEYKDPETYIALNKVFRMINNQMEAPTEDQRELVEYLLSEFERVHRWDKGSKGKLLIQRKYLERW